MAGPDDATHPLNRKAKLQVYVRDLQDECGLTDAALQHIALICGPRYTTHHTSAFEGIINDRAHYCGKGDRSLMQRLSMMFKKSDGELFADEHQKFYQSETATVS